MSSLLHLMMKYMLIHSQTELMLSLKTSPTNLAPKQYYSPIIFGVQTFVYFFITYFILILLYDVMKLVFWPC